MKLDFSRSTVTLPALTVLAGSASALVGTMAVRIIMARALTPAELGIVLLGIALVSAAGGVAGLGLATAAAERVARLRAAGQEALASRCAVTSVRLGAASGLAVSGLVVTVAWLAAEPAGLEGLSATVMVLTPVVFALAVGTSALGAARGYGDSFGRAVLRDGGGGLLRAVAVGAAVLWGGGRLGVAAGFALGSMVAEAAFVAYAKSKGYLGSARTGGADRPLATSLAPFVIVEACTQLGAWMDLVILGALVPVAVVGVYGVARGLTKAAQLVLSSVSHSFLPHASAYGSGPELVRLYWRSRLFSFALVWPAVVVFLLLPGEVLVVLFGADYAQGASPLRILGVALLVDWLATGKDTTLVAAGAGAAVSRAAGLATILGLVATGGLVPRLGAQGAALGLLTMACARSVLLAVELGRREEAPLHRHDLPLALILGVIGVLASVVWVSEPSARFVFAIGAAGLGSGLAVWRLWRTRQPALAR